MNQNATPGAPAGARKTSTSLFGTCSWCSATEGLTNFDPFHDHHVAGRANDPVLTMRLCPSCHAAANQMLRTHEVDLDHDSERSVIEVIVAVIVGIALVLWTFAKRLFHWAAQLTTLAAALDEQYQAGGPWQRLCRERGDNSHPCWAEIVDSRATDQQRPGLQGRAALRRHCHRH